MGRVSTHVFAWRAASEALLTCKIQEYRKVSLKPVVTSHTYIYADHISKTDHIMNRSYYNRTYRLTIFQTYNIQVNHVTNTYRYKKYRLTTSRTYNIQTDQIMEIQHTD